VPVQIIKYDVWKAALIKLFDNPRKNVLKSLAMLDALLMLAIHNDSKDVYDNWVDWQEVLKRFETLWKLTRYGKERISVTRLRTELTVLKGIGLVLIWNRNPGFDHIDVWVKLKVDSDDLQEAFGETKRNELWRLKSILSVQKLLGGRACLDEPMDKKY